VDFLFRFKENSLENNGSCPFWSFLEIETDLEENKEVKVVNGNNKKKFRELKDKFPNWCQKGWVRIKEGELSIHSEVFIGIGP
jgi:hypothetical protein